MYDLMISMCPDNMRRRILRDVRERFPNFDVMPDSIQLECVADHLHTGLSRLLARNAAMQQHAKAYEQFLDA